jgi:hypothetical protein
LCRSFQELNTQEARFAPRTLQAAQSPPFHLWIAHRCGASSRGKNDKGFPVSFVRYFNEPIISCEGNLTRTRRTISIACQ